MLETGLVQVYTGDGKGKTTAALGLALRAAGQGLNVVIYQFLKPPARTSGERQTLMAYTDKVRLEILEAPWDLTTSLSNRRVCAEMSAAVKRALEQAGQLIEQGLCDMLILDEIVFCLAKGLTRIEDIKQLIHRKAPHVEVVMTGRGATQELLDLADLVTEMKNVKHPFDKGLSARMGIEY
jgi:cob(I)alamin adenosyltransferase